MLLGVLFVEFVKKGVMRIELGVAADKWALVDRAGSPRVQTRIAAAAAGACCRGELLVLHELTPSGERVTFEKGAAALLILKGEPRLTEEQKARAERL